MKLKAPDGVGDPCIAGVAIKPRSGVYEVAPEVGALLIECFGFVAVGQGEDSNPAKSAAPRFTPRRRATSRKA